MKKSEYIENSFHLGDNHLLHACMFSDCGYKWPYMTLYVSDRNPLIPTSCFCDSQTVNRLSCSRFPSKSQRAKTDPRDRAMMLVCPIHTKKDFQQAAAQTKV